MVYIINFGSSKTPDIVKVVQSLGYESTIVSWNQPQQINFEKAHAFILSGAPVLLTEKSADAYLGKYSFIKTISQPVLGICFGHQLIGMLYNSKVFKGEEVRKPIPINIVADDILFTGLLNISTFTEDHTEGIDLPNDFVLLASSEKYEIEAMKHTTRNIYGVQFHPEVSGENGTILIKNFLKLG